MTSDELVISSFVASGAEDVRLVQVSDLARFVFFGPENGYLAVPEGYFSPGDSSPTLLYFVAQAGSAIVATVRLRIGETFQLERMAISKEYRRSGLGSRMLRALEAEVRRRGGLRVDIPHAWKPASGFYVRNGYTVIGDEFDRAGEPHVRLFKQLPRIVRFSMSDSALFDIAIDVRRKVFVDEQGFSLEEEPDQFDATSEHWLVDNVGTVRFRRDVGKLGRLAVLKSHRGQGLGRLLVEAVERDVAATHKVIALAAQIPAVPFYEALGYKVQGEPFDDDGQPHLLAVKTLA